MDINFKNTSWSLPSTAKWDRLPTKKFSKFFLYFNKVGLWFSSVAYNNNKQLTIIKQQVFT